MKNRLIICFLLVAAIVAASSCAPKDPYIDDERDDTPLQVYLMYYNTYEIDAINKYNRAIDDGIIEGRKIEITEFELEELENMHDRIFSEMMAGKGPDIIFFRGYTDYYFDLTKMAKQDAFADFDILIEKSETFSLNDYNKGALDTGIIDGKRILMPLSYKVNYIVTTQENLDAIDVSAPEYLTYENFFEIIETWHKSTDSVGAEYPSSQMFYDMITEDGLDEQGIDELKKCIDLEIEDDARAEPLGLTSGNIVDFYQYICNGDFLIHYTRSTGGSTGEFNLLYELYNVVENLYNKSFVLLNEPTISAETSYGYIIRGCVINMNSKHKNEAFKFVEFMLSEQYQYSNVLQVNTIPVNIAAYESAKSDFMNDVYIESYHDYATTPLPNDIKESYISLVEGVSGYKYIGQERYIYRHVISDILDDYKNGKIDFGTMIEEMNRKIKLYYSE